MSDTPNEFFEDFLVDRSLSDKAVEDRMVAELDRLLGSPPRQHLESGTLLFEDGDWVDGVWLLLEGNVRLFRVVDGEEIVFHVHTVGPVIGLLAFASQSNASYSCRAATDITVVRLRGNQLEEALSQSPRLQGHFATVLMRSLASRQHRAAEQRVEIKRLNRQLAEERDEAARTLESLQRAQLRLVESEKMATLGELAAGVAHDLNNPATAISRSAEFLSEDLLALADRSEHPEWARRVLTTALTWEPLSTRHERALRHDLVEAIADEQLARRLLRCGITTPAELETEFEGLTGTAFDERLSERESYFQIGSSLRSIEAAARRIAALVSSLRSHARPARELSSDVDVNTTIDESLLLLGHELTGIEVVLQFGTIPRISAYPSELGQIWTNLVSNAVEAMGGTGVLTITTDQPDPKHVRVMITDTGAGIPMESLQQIFDINYTTKQGRVEFGIGLGLTITAQIVQRHNGTIDVVSQPGQTTFTIRLPITPGDQQ